MAGGDATNDCTLLGGCPNVKTGGDATVDWPLLVDGCANVKGWGDAADD
jgi:hypothetical protein